MTNFKIELLTPVSRQGVVMFLSSTMTDFSSQRDLYTNKQQFGTNTSYSYTSNEKFSIKQNAQKSLTFTMYRKVLQGEYWEDNPYVDNVHIGSQLALTDKYGFEHLFTVTDIQFKISEINVEYNYTCQDTFNYQTIRQNDGYTITNDASTDDFIGAKTADWWIFSKIKPDCYITYEFLPFGRGLYLGVDKQIRSFIASDKLKSVDEIIKPIYTDSVFFETIPFSCSGSNGVAALISLAEQIGCQINVFEKRYTDNEGYLYYNKYFWLEPSKNSQPTGLKYSPKNNVKSFNLSFKGASLTTVMNVLTSEVGDEMISLFPSVPGIFASYFQTQEWQKSKYYRGMFTDIINGTYYTNKGEDKNIEVDLSVFNIYYKNARYATIGLQTPGFATFFIPVYYNQIQFSWSSQEVTSYFLDNEAIQLTNKSRPLLLFLTESKLENYSSLDGKTVDDSPISFVRKDVIVLHEGEEIPSHLLGKKLYCYIGVPVASDYEETPLQNVNLNCCVTRDFSEEEYMFAKIADQCPWLENKLIDFNYFLEQNILSKDEYQVLMDFLVNDIRVINGQLMASSSSYYQALHQQTKVLADLQSKLDMIGAECQSAIINPYAETGTVTDISRFDLSYRSLFQANNSQQNSLLNYAQELSNTFDKFFKAEQRFLKNTYNFRQYFNTVNGFSIKENACLVQDTLSIDLDKLMNEVVIDKDNYQLNYITFSPTKYNSIYDQGYKLKTSLYHERTLEPLVSFYEYDQVYRAVETVAESNITSFSKPLLREGSVIKIGDELPVTEETDATWWQYNKENTYFLPWNQYEHLLHLDPYLLEKDESKLSINEKDIISRIHKIDMTKEEDTVHTFVDMVELTTEDLTKLYLIKNPGQYYLRDTKRYIPLDWIRYVPSVATSTEKTKDEESDSDATAIMKVNRAVFSGNNFRLMLYPNVFAEKENNHKSEERIPSQKSCDNGNRNAFWGNYRQHFPLTEAAFYGPVIKVTEAPEDDTSSAKYTYDQVNEKGQNFATWRDADPNLRGSNPSSYQAFQSMVFYTSLSAGYVSKDQAHEQYKKEYDEFAYFSYSWENGSQLAKNIAVGLAITGGILSVIPVIGWIYSALAFAGAAASGIASAALRNGTWKQYYHPRQVISRDVNAPDKIVYYKNLGATERTDTVVFDASKDNNKNDYSYFDSYYPLFLRAPENVQIRKQYVDDLKIEYPSLGQENQFCNYYNLVVGTYSFDYEVPYTSYENEDKERIYSLKPPYDNQDKPTNYKLWTKGSYWRVLPAGATINKNDTYYLLPLMLKSIPGDDELNVISEPVEFETQLLHKLTTEWRDQLLVGYSSAADDDSELENKVRIPFNSIEEIMEAYDQWREGNAATSLGNDVLNSLKWENRIYNQTQYYFWKPFLTPLNFATVDSFWTDANKTTGQLQYRYLDSDDKDADGNLTGKKSPIAYQIVDMSQNRSAGWAGKFLLVFVVLHEENYEQALITNTSSVQYRNYWSNYTNNLGYEYPAHLVTDTVYQKNTDQSVDLILKDDLLKPQPGIMEFYCLSAKDSMFVPCTIDDWKEHLSLNSTIKFYKKVGDDKYIRHYSLYELIKTNGPRPAYYFLDGFISPVYNFIDNETQFKTALYLHSLKITDGEVEEHDVIQYPGLYHLNFNPDQLWTYISIPHGGKTYECYIDLIRGTPEYFKTMSNGEFWYRYRDRTELTLLFEQCAIIETELTMYWEQALTASKYCSYFLPDSWTPTVNQAVNYWNQDIILPVYQDSVAEGIQILDHLELSNRFLPNVKMHKDRKLNMEKPFWLPKFNLTFNYQPSYVEHYSSIGQQVLNTNTVKASDVLSNNPAFIQTLTHLLPNTPVDLALSMFSAEENGKMNYYYATSGGLTWNKLLDYVKKDCSDYNNFDGLYGMQFKILLSSFKERPISNYEVLLKQKLSLWQYIYQAFPNVLLETSFSYDKATTSEELLRMAQLAMRDKTHPEENYTISLLDAYSLQGYRGQRIKIGDSIALDANEFYGEIDDLYKALTKFLFITDINYTLRDSANVNVTVNTIKYQDKLLQQLVKLIR